MKSRSLKVLSLLAALAVGFALWWGVFRKPSPPAGDTAMKTAAARDEAVAPHGPGSAPMPAFPAESSTTSSSDQDGSIPTSLRTNEFLQSQTRALAEERKRRKEESRAKWEERRKQRRAEKLERLREKYPERAAEKEAKWAREEQQAAEREARRQQAIERNNARLNDPNYVPPPREVTRPGIPTTPLQFEEGAEIPANIDPSLVERVPKAESSQDGTAVEAAPKQ